MRQEHVLQLYTPFEMAAIPLMIDVDNSCIRPHVHLYAGHEGALVLWLLGPTDSPLVGAPAVVGCW